MQTLANSQINNTDTQVKELDLNPLKIREVSFLEVWQDLPLCSAPSSISGHPGAPSQPPQTDSALLSCQAIGFVFFPCCFNELNWFLEAFNASQSYCKVSCGKRWQGASSTALSSATNSNLSPKNTPQTQLQQSETVPPYWQAPAPKTQQKVQVSLLLQLPAVLIS